MPRAILSLKPILVATLLLGLLLSGCSSDGGGPSLETSDTLVNKGSDTIVNLALAWAEAYRVKEPQVSIAVTGGGSGTGIAALINGTVDIANASRQIKPEEQERARSNGIDPMEFVIARDAIAIIVNPSNPVDELSIDQLSNIYSGKINNWSELGGEDRPIVRLSRETNSGTHVYFLEQVLRKGDKEDSTLFSPDTLLLPSSEGIISETRENPNAIGYDGLGYVTDEVKVIAVSGEPSGPFVLPSIDSVNAAQYPISRDLYMYTAGKPSGPIQAYLEWIMQEDAQTIVSDLGFVPATQ
jgi:phosphate transport system substrate-binding protein